MKRYRFCLACGSLAAAIGLAGGCSGDKAPKSGLSGGCVANSDCASGLVCAFDRCHNECTESSECIDGERCVKADDEVSVCLLPSEVDCDNDRDCPEPLLCGDDGECRNECDADSDCPEGQVCSRQQVCAEPDEVDGAGNLLLTGSASGTGGSGTTGTGGMGTDGEGGDRGIAGAAGSGAATQAAGGDGGATMGAGGAAAGTAGVGGVAATAGSGGASAGAGTSAAAGANAGAAQAGSAGTAGSDASVAGRGGSAGSDGSPAGSGGAAGTDGSAAGSAGTAGTDASAAGSAGAAGTDGAVAGRGGAGGADASTAGSAGAAGAFPVTIVLPEPLTAGCYLELEPGSSLDFATLVSDAAGAALQLALLASTQSTLESLVTITGTTATFAASAEYPGAHAFEFELRSATDADRLLVVVDYTLASATPIGAGLYASVDEANGALGTAAAVPELVASGAATSGFLHLANGGLECCDSGSGLLCNWCVRSMLMLRSSWPGVVTTFEGCNPACAAGSLCVLGLGCVAEDATQSGDCVASNTGTHYLEGQGCRFVAMHQGPYSLYRDTENAPLVEGEVAATIGHSVDVSAPETDGRCGFIGLLGELAGSPPFFTDATCDTSTNQCATRMDAGEVDRYALLYIIQSP